MLALFPWPHLGWGCPFPWFFSSFSLFVSCVCFCFPVVLVFLSVFCLWPRVLPPPPRVFGVFFPAGPCVFFLVFFPPASWLLDPVSCPPAPPPPKPTLRLFCFFCFSFFLCPLTCCRLVFFFRGGAAAPRPFSAMTAHPALLCAVLFHFGGACSLVLVRLVVVLVLPPPHPSRPPPCRYVVCFLPAAPLFFLLVADSFLVLLLLVCAAVLCRAGVLVSCGGSLCAVHRWSLLCCFSFFALCGPCVLCCLAWCCAVSLSVACGDVLVSRCVLRCWAASLCAVVLSCVVVRCCALCGAGLWWSWAVPCCGVSCCGVPPCAVWCAVRFVAVFMLFAALSPVLARRPWVWRCCALWRSLWCVELFLPVLCLVARLVGCCGALC